MKKTSIAALVVLAFVMALATITLAQGSKALEGTWKLDAAKSTFSPGPPPQTMTVTYSAVGPGGVKAVIDVTPATGSAQHWEMTAQYDGKEYPITGNPNADMVSMKRIDDLTTESTFKKAGKVTSTNVRKVSADGKTLTVTSKGVTLDGKPRTDVQVFAK